MTIAFYSAAFRPVDEAARQAAVHRSGVLDTRPDPVLDVIVARAAALFGAPAAAISILDGNRQAFIARQGLAVDQTARAPAFCAHAIADPERLLVVPDTLADDRFRANRLVTDGMRLRFYAGAVVRAPCGQPLGTLCVLDDRPHLRPDQDALAGLRTLARAATAHIGEKVRARPVE